MSRNVGEALAVEQERERDGYGERKREEESME